MTRFQIEKIKEETKIEMVKKPYPNKAHLF